MGIVRVSLYNSDVQIDCVGRGGDGVAVEPPTPSTRRTMVARRGDGVMRSPARAGRRANANNSDGTRTRNPQIRSLIRYPLRHGVVCGVVEEQGFEPWAFRMQSGRSATELHPRAIPTGLEPATPRFEV